MMYRPPEEVIKENIERIIWEVNSKSASICDNCQDSNTCKWHNNDKNKHKQVRDCGRFNLSSELEEFNQIQKELDKLRK